jgi:uncharacterized CHY-type Zn-finger protein
MLPPEHFHRNRAQTCRQGRSWYCRPCAADYQRQRFPNRTRAVKAQTRPGYYRCAICKNEYARSEFGTRTKNSRRKRSSYCRPCERAMQRENYAAAKNDPDRSWFVRRQRQIKQERYRADKRKEATKRIKWVHKTIRGLIADGWSVSDLARGIGVKPDTIIKWRDGVKVEFVWPRNEEKIRTFLGTMPTMIRRREQIDQREAA